jgi:hypothetical protein
MDPETIKARRIQETAISENLENSRVSRANDVSP